MSTETAAEQLPLMMSITDLRTLMGCGRTVAYERTQQPSFPMPVAFSEKAYRWWRHEVIEWVEAQRMTTRPTKARAAKPAQTTYLVADEQLPAPRPVVRRGRAT